MPPPKRPWFRFYVETVWDRKLRRLPAAQRWVWVAILALARQSPEPGRLLLTDLSPVGTEDIADASAVSPRIASASVHAFKRARMLQQDPGGVLVVTKWKERQFESDDVGKRTSKHRRQNAEGTPDEGEMERSNNGEGTPPENREQKTEVTTSSSSDLSTGVDGPVDDGDDEDVTIMNLRAHFEGEGFAAVDIEPVLTRLGHRRRFGGKPITDPVAWAEKSIQNLERERHKATVGAEPRRYRDTDAFGNEVVYEYDRAAGCWREAEEVQS